MNADLRKKYEIPLENLNYECDKKEFDLTTHANKPVSLESLIIGQKNAITSIKKGLRMPGKEYNLFVTGPPGTGRKTILNMLIKQYINNMPREEYETKLSKKKDFIAAYNFENPDNKLILSLPLGHGEGFKARVEAAADLILNKEMKRYQENMQIPDEMLNQNMEALKEFAIKEGKGLQAKVLAAQEEIKSLNEKLDSMKADDPERDACIKRKEEFDKILIEIDAKAKKFDAELQKKEAKLRTDHELQKKSYKERFDGNIKSIIDELKQEYVDNSRIDNLKENINLAEKNIVKLDYVELSNKNLSMKQIRLKEKVKNLLRQLKKEYKQKVKIDKYLTLFEEAIKKDSGESSAQAQGGAGLQMNPAAGMMLLGMGGQGGMPGMPQPGVLSHDELAKYKLNLLSDRENDENTKELKGIPVIFEDKPTLENLFGIIKNSQPMMTPDGKIIKKKDLHMNMQAGSLIKASGGYLMINMADLLSEGSEIALRRLMKDLDNGKTKIGHNLPFSYVFTDVQESDEVDIDTKVILLGNEGIYQSLVGISKSGFYEEFRRTFNIKTEMDFVTDNSPESRNNFANYLSYLCSHEGLKNMSKNGIAEIIKYSAASVSEQNKLSIDLTDIANIVKEANEDAIQNNSKYIGANHIRKALNDRDGRHNLIKGKYNENIEKGIKIINTDGYAVGSINALAVMGLNDVCFGSPIRMTAVTYLGCGSMMSIDKNAGMTGQSFRKADDIMKTNFKRLFTQDKSSIPVDVSISFEQSYGSIDGDSATLAEFLVTLSSLSDKPIDQGIAVTSSMNQLGEIQPIGGVNEKVEGFYDVCKSKGLTGNQGVLIAKQNIEHLMLKDEVVEDVKKGNFHLYAIESLEEGIEVMFGMEAGYDRKGEFKPGTVYDATNQRIKEFTDLKKNLGEDDKKDDKKDEKECVVPEEKKEDPCDGCGDDCNPKF